MKPQELVVWRALGSWSGTGNAQTETFVSESGSLRLRWQTRNGGSNDNGDFKLILQSSVSGRALAVAADHRGIGSGESFVPETPRPMYVLVESADLDWSFSVDEGFVGTAVTGSRQD
jgi:hypothetical protein